ncbi:hypothetical protein Hypma_011145 [Hypsizygus marmoreus]|uniref:Uncharacterized protein n=1 Tax=Hypsizygus marmoreus TaxID=39966 RepID=A0A369JL48_HYPMA|nr:hypothetical protein Hypma_011145 [Hypsizygus marmoreus]
MSSSEASLPPDRDKISLDSLPNELISVIFIHMYMISRKQAELARGVYGSDEGEYSNQDMTWKDEDLLDPNLFPKGIVAVCRRWREIAERLPILWTRIVAFVDSSPTPLSEVQAYLTLSRDLPLQVYVLRRPDPDLEEDLGERPRCRDVIELLVPHIPRCQKIDFDVIYSSSLPSICKDFFGHATLLETLNLKCETDAEIASGSSNPRSEIAEEPFLTPALKDLCVDGRNFIHASLALPSWIESIPKGQLRLAVHNFSPSDSISQDLEFTLHDFILFQDRLKVIRLSLSKVEFHDHSTPAPNVLLFADPLELKELSYEMFMDIMAFIGNGLTSIHISECDVAYLGFDFHSDSLTLEGISDDTDISGFLSSWSGRELKVSNCPGFDDITLDTLGKNNGRIRSLIVENCPKISPEGVMEMAQSLNERLALQQRRRGGFQDRKTCALENLRILGHPHVLTSAEERWFRQNASSGEFVWTARK